MDTDRVKRVFLGSKLRIAGTVVLSLVALVALGYLLGIFGVPTVEDVENSFGDVNETTTVIETDLVVANPNPIGFKLGGSTLEYAVSMNDVRMAEGTYSGLGIGPGTTTLNFTSFMDNTQIPAWWASHVENGEQTTVVVDATVRSSLLPISLAPPKIERPVSTNITDAFNTTETQQIRANQPLVEDPVLYVNETSGHWGEVNETETEIVMDFVLYNPKSYPISASEIGYNMSMNDVRIGEGETDSSVTIPPQSTREITASTVIRNQRLDQWWVSHLVQNQRTNLSIDFYAQLDFASGGFGSFRIPLDTMEESFTTDIFDTKGNSTDGQSGETGADSGTDDDSSGTVTDDGGDAGTGTDDDPLLGDTDEGTTTDDGSSTTTDDGGSESTATETPTDDGGGLLG